MRDLSAYPGDIALDAVEGWSGRFFPAWIELKEEILSDKRLVQRNRRIRALQEFINAKPEPERKPVTDEQIKRMKRAFPKLNAA